MAIIYVSLRKIAKRMGWRSPQTVLRNYEWHDFPIIRRNLAHGRWCWVTDDLMIVEWLKRQWKPHARYVVPRRHHETCQRCGATMLVQGQSRMKHVIEQITQQPK